jgi:hypothetical protein
MKKETVMKMSLLALLTTLSLAAPPPCSDVDWGEIRKDWQSYLAKPSPPLAESLLKQLSRPLKDCRERPGFQETNEVIYRDLGELEKQVRTFDPWAARIAFHLMSFADGDFAESLDIMLGSTITKRPKLFLSELKKSRVVCEGGLVANLGEISESEPGAELKELKARQKALGSVKDEALQSVQKECEGVLRDVIRRETQKKKT